MTHRERHIADVTVLDVDGRVTIEDGADALRDTFHRLIAEGISKLIVNCQNVPYVDTSGLTTLIRAYTSVTRRGGSLKLVHVAPRVQELLRVTKLSSVLEAYDTETAAIESFTKESV